MRGSGVGGGGGLTMPIKMSPTQLSGVHSLRRLCSRAMNPLLNAKML